MYYLFVLTSLLSDTKNHKNLIIWSLSLFEKSPGDPRRRLKRKWYHKRREILNGFKPLLITTGKVLSLDEFFLQEYNPIILSKFIRIVKNIYKNCLVIFEIKILKKSEFE